VRLELFLCARLLNEIGRFEGPGLPVQSDQSMATWRDAALARVQTKYLDQSIASCSISMAILSMSEPLDEHFVAQTRRLLALRLSSRNCFAISPPRNASHVAASESGRTTSRHWTCVAKGSSRRRSGFQ